MSNDVISWRNLVLLFVAATSLTGDDGLKTYKNADFETRYPQSWRVSPDNVVSFYSPSGDVSIVVEFVSVAGAGNTLQTPAVLRQSVDQHVRGLNQKWVEVTSPVMRTEPVGSETGIELAYVHHSNFSEWKNSGGRARDEALFIKAVPRRDGFFSIRLLGEMVAVGKHRYNVYEKLVESTTFFKDNSRLEGKPSPRSRGLNSDCMKATGNPALDQIQAKKCAEQPRINADKILDQIRK